MRRTKIASLLLCSLLLATSPLAMNTAQAQESSGPIFLNKIKNFFGGSTNNTRSSNTAVAPLQQRPRTQASTAKGSSGAFNINDYKDAQGRLPGQAAADKRKMELQQAQVSRANLQRQLAALDAQRDARNAQENAVKAAGGAVVAPGAPVSGQPQPYVQQPRIVIPQSENSGTPKPIFKNYR